MSDRIGHGVSRADFVAALIVIVCAGLGLLTVLWAGDVEPMSMVMEVGQ